MLDGLSFAEKLISCLFDASLRDLVVEVEAKDWGVLSVLCGAGEREHQASGDVVEFSVALERD